MNKITEPGTRAVKGSFWTALLFYLLIAFEFLYMASPFAVYAYSVYGPGLRFLSVNPVVAGLSRFFIPHIVIESRLPLLDAHNGVGAIIAGIGFLSFLVCAGQVYLSKLTRKKAVTGGLYRWIRHPQYAAFLLCGFGMLLIWPRFLVLVMLVVMSFVYYFLARAEERECVAKFGASYTRYKERTGMFLPFRLALPPFLARLPARRSVRIALTAVLFVVSLSAALGVGLLIQELSVAALYTTGDRNAVWLSVHATEDQEREAVRDLVLSDERIQSLLAEAGGQARFINYIHPQEWSVPEVPSSENLACHRSPPEFNRNLIKVSLTRAVLPGSGRAEGLSILKRATHKELLAEVWIDLEKGQVTRVLPAGRTAQYQGIPVPVY